MNTQNKKTVETMKRKALRAKRAVERGMTLIEIMIVVAIIAMVTAGVAAVALPKMKEAQIKQAATGARVIRVAVQQWQLAENEYSECPTVSQLVADKQLDAGQDTADPWGEDYSVVCTEDDEVIVASTGPDKKVDTKDDIVIPKPDVEDEDED